MKLVVMTAAYNEEKNIADVVKKIPRNIKDIDYVEIALVDDGSTDDTTTVAIKAGADSIITHKKNNGLGVAFRSGMAFALKNNADVIVNIDGDGQFNPKDITVLVEPILRGEADFVTASRFLDRSHKPRIPWIKLLGNKLFTRLTNYITGQELKDTQCGFRAYSREAAMRLDTFGDFTYTQEVFIDLLNKGMRVKEIPIQIREREGKSRVVTHWYSYGFKALAIIIRTFRDYKPLKFFGFISLATLIPGIGIGIFLIYHYITTGQTSPYASMLYLVVIFVVMSIIFLVLALVADMIGRLRKILEELLYLSKRREYDNVDK
jgi:glycosyltransferase involved in cell wall biosynthesis